ncbi:MAG: hypothetical protein ACLFV4_07680 [Candidatus Hydrogenedentota bacterium]
MRTVYCDPVQTRETPRPQEAGMALVVATLFIAVAMVTLGSLAMRVINQSHQTDHDLRQRMVFLGLEAAYAESLAAIESGNTGLVGTENWDEPANPATIGDIPVPAFGDSGVAPRELTDHPGVEYFAYVVDWGNDNRDNNGNSVVDGDKEQGWYTIYAFARWDGLVRRAEILLNSTDVNVWRNAIFAGAGQSGGLINGNVSIHGSVHLLGQNITEGGTAIAALDLSGTSLIHNNYAGLPQDLSDRVPPLPEVEYDGETVETLNANLRVKNGLVALSGNSEIGAPQQTGNGVKEPMDGTFVNDGWTGNSSIDDGDRGVPTRVTSDNGWNQFYDLGDKVPFPVFSDDYRSMTNGARVQNPNTGKYYSHEDYFEQVLTGEPYEGDITINARRTDEFYFNASNPEHDDPGARSGNYIYYDGDTKTLEINGPVLINGNLSLDGQGNQGTIHYTGSAAWLVRGDVDLGVNLYAVNADGSTERSFPSNILGIMAEGAMMVGENAQLDLMGAFYSEQGITTQKQSDILGTFVSSHFDMGTNVPSIYQVPTLADNLPEGMIGAYPIRVMSQVSWREL